MRNTYPFMLDPLDYPMDALEPFIDEQTMNVHFNILLRNYVNKLNDALEHYPELQFWTLEQLLINAALLPSAVKEPIINNAGGVFNHYLFFDMLTAPEESQMNNEFSVILRKEFGSLQRFETLFVDAATKVFGSGYVWLVLNHTGNLGIVTTSNQDNPFSFGVTPILTLDMWEHAFFCQYISNKRAYASNWFRLIHWNRVYKRYRSIVHSNLDIYKPPL